jgi:DcmR-like sensory protein
MSQHSCQFFDSDESRAEAVSAFIAEGLRTDDQLLVIAQPMHWAAIAECLEALHVSVSRELASRRLVVKDATDTLRQLTKGPRLSAHQFDHVVGTMLRGFGRARPLRAYGEMVDILAQRGEQQAALELESLWNDLGAVIPFNLMCGYAAAHFVSASAHAALRGICAAHSHVRRHDDDALANWLLTAAHNPIAPASFPSH